MSDLTYDDPRITFLADQVRAILRERRGITLGPTWAATYIAMAANREADKMGLTGGEFLRRHGIPDDIAQGIADTMASSPPEQLEAPELLQ